jgi:hypothetical protein
MVSRCAIAPRFHSWKAEVADVPSVEAEFGRWLFVRAASVLFEKKAGELVCMPADLFGFCRFERLTCVDKLARVWGNAYMVLHQSANSDKIIIYDPEKVRRRLAATPPCILCGELGYARDIGPEGFLTQVRQRWYEGKTIPHEIGLALGYPIKDVLGYMGFLPLPYTGSCGWRIYGDPTPSRMMSEECEWAKRQAICFLEHGQSTHPGRRRPDRDRVTPIPASASTTGESSARWA